MMPRQDDKLLKKDLFGEVRLQYPDSGPRIVRDVSGAPMWSRWVARRLMAREARSLAAIDCLSGVPELLRCEGDTLRRSYIAGDPMQVARPSNPDYFRNALHLLRRLHSLGVVHNDLAKEPNWLVTPDGQPALIDFQLAWYSPQRGRLFRLLAREDLRHMLKHKRTYLPQRLTSRERAILASPSLPARAWRASGKRVYLFVTRRLLGWADREGAGDRGHSN
ncbi:MAG: hypothetical protein RIA65_00560 [Woeseia sp.]